MHKVLYVCMYIFGPYLASLNSHIILQEPAEAQQTFSSLQDPTVWCTLPIFEYLQEQWTLMELAPKFGEVSSAISMALENVNKWYVNESDAYFICLSIPSDIVFVVQSCD